MVNVILHIVDFVKVRPKGVKGFVWFRDVVILIDHELDICDVLGVRLQVSNLDRLSNGSDKLKAD